MAFMLLWILPNSTCKQNKIVGNRLSVNIDMVKVFHLGSGTHY